MEFQKWERIPLNVPQVFMGWGPPVCWAMDSGLMGCCEVSEMLHVDSCASFCFVYSHCWSSLHFSSPTCHPKLLTGRLPDAATHSSVLGGSLQVYNQLQGPSCGPVTLLCSPVSLPLGFLCCQQAWDKYPQEQPSRCHPWHLTAP